MGLCKGGGRELDGSPAAGAGSWLLSASGKGLLPALPATGSSKAFCLRGSWMLLWFGEFIFFFFLMSRHRATRKTYKEVLFKVTEGKRGVYVAVYANSY